VVKFKIKNCQRCHREFEPYHAAQKFCLLCKAGSRQDWFRKRDKARFASPEGKIANHINSKAYRDRTKIAAFEAYGGKCTCCGEINSKFLTIDHINSNGAEHKRQTNGRAKHMYLWLKNNNYPDGFQVLCYNCNCGRAINGGVCPHKDVAHE